MIMTTTHTIEGHTILEYRGIAFGEIISGVSVLRDIGTGTRNFFGVRSSGYEEELMQARKAALNEMGQRAEEMGANAVVGLVLIIRCLAKTMNCSWSALVEQLLSSTDFESLTPRGGNMINDTFNHYNGTLLRNGLCTVLGKRKCTVERCRATDASFKASANNAMNVLAEKQLVVSEKYREIRLTQNGYQLAHILLEKHNILQQLLRDVIGKTLNWLMQTLVLLNTSSAQRPSKKSMNFWKVGTKIGVLKLKSSP